MTFPIWWESHKSHVPVTTNQSLSSFSPSQALIHSWFLERWRLMPTRPFSTGKSSVHSKCGISSSIFIHFPQQSAKGDMMWHDRFWSRQGCQKWIIWLCDHAWDMRHIFTHVPMIETGEIFFMVIRYSHHEWKSSYLRYKPLLIGLGPSLIWLYNSYIIQCLTQLSHSEVHNDTAPDSHAGVSAELTVIGYREGQE